MKFHNINLPDFIAVFAIGQFTFSTSIATTKSGRELKILDREGSFQKYLIKNCRLNEQEFNQFNSFFRARKGQNFAFKFKDFTDYKISRQMLAFGDGIKNEFQIFKLYEDSVNPYRKIIHKPVINKCVVYVDNIIIKPEISDNGIILLTSPLPLNSCLIIDCEFEVITRFNQDSFEYHYSNGAIQLSNIELIEVNI